MGPCARVGVIFQKLAFFLRVSINYATLAYDFAKICKNVWGTYKVEEKTYKLLQAMHTYGAL